MFQRIEENLVRQNKAMILLQVLFEEEFSRLRGGDALSVSRLELSIQELIRQMAAERASLRKMVGRTKNGARRVSELYDLMTPEQVAAFVDLVKVLDSTEQRCAAQAAKNHELALAFHDQSKALLEFMHEEIRPKNTGGYSAKGRFAKVAEQPSLLRGRL